MAFRHLMRFGWLATAVAMIGTATPSYATTANTSDYGWGNVIAIGCDTFDRAFDLMPVAIESEPASVLRTRHDMACKPIAIHERASRSAIRPTAVAGWRSGRTRHLAVA